MNSLNKQSTFFESRLRGFLSFGGVSILVSLISRMISPMAITVGYVLSALLLLLSVAGLFVHRYRRFAQGALLFFALACIPLLILVLNIVLTGSVMRAQ